MEYTDSLNQQPDREKIKALLRSYFSEENDVHHVIMFGSIAAGDQSKHSDLDLVVVKNTQQRFIRRLTDNYLDLDDVVGMPVDIFIYTPEEWESKKNSLFFKNTPMEAVV